MADVLHSSRPRPQCGRSLLGRGRQGRHTGPRRLSLAGHVYRLVPVGPRVWVRIESSRSVRRLWVPGPGDFLWEVLSRTSYHAGVVGSPKLVIKPPLSLTFTSRRQTSARWGWRGVGRWEDGGGVSHGVHRGVRVRTTVADSRSEVEVGGSPTPGLLVVFEEPERTKYHRPEDDGSSTQGPFGRF